MRTFRSRTTVLATAGAAVFALSLTACGGDGSGVRSAGAASGDTTVTVSSSKSAGSSDVVGAAKGSDGSVARGAKSGGAGASAAAPVCTTKDVSVSATRHGGPPYTHIVLTAENTSGRSCAMTGFPEIQFLESHRENVPPVAKSKPAAPVVLKAGAPAYALVKLSDGGAHEDNEVVTDFSVTLQGGGGMTAVAAPGKGGIAVDPAKWATGYWTYELRNGADDF
ncbi:DUF4232 domain-containing protein [Streptomyces sp. 135]|uniref:DUF4232 domain-containing protein n=1 Tax=Streptomyces sp. 135 TaxID=2838850 RepID=UPI001CC0CFE3|nr:DUF4232 domain-containing protein [Streptomyces sp. 135]